MSIVKFIGATRYLATVEHPDLTNGSQPDTGP